MTINNSMIIFLTDWNQFNQAFEELWKLRNFAGAQEIYYGMIALWIIYAILHIVSVYIIIEGVRKRNREYLANL